MSPKLNRYKLLLDEMFPTRKNFPEINKFHNLQHITHDIKKSGSKDQTVVKLAKKENRILISKNEKHMVDLCIKANVTLICVTEKMQNEEIDKQIISILKDLNPKDLIIKLSHKPRKK